MCLANFAPSSVSSRKKLLDCYIYGGLSYNNPMHLANFAPSWVSSRKKLLHCYIYGRLSYNKQENH